MSRHLRSARGGLAIVGRLRLLATAAAIWAAAFPLGVAISGLAVADLGLPAGDATLRLHLVGMALSASPLFSWIGWVAALPLAALALHAGWFGWLPAALIGAFSGWLAGELVHSDIAGGFGLVCVLALRLILGWLVPAAFDPETGR